MIEKTQTAIRDYQIPEESTPSDSGYTQAELLKLFCPFSPDRAEDVEPSRQATGLWYNTGERRLSSGHEIFDRELTAYDNKGTLSRTALRLGLQHYALALNDFARHAGEALNRGFILWQIQRRLTYCPLEALGYLRAEALPEIMETHRPSKASREILAHLLGLALAIKSRNQFEYVI